MVIEKEGKFLFKMASFLEIHQAYAVEKKIAPRLERSARFMLVVRENHKSIGAFDQV